LPHTHIPDRSVRRKKGSDSIKAKKPRRRVHRQKDEQRKGTLYSLKKNNFDVVMDKGGAADAAGKLGESQRRVVRGEKKRKNIWVTSIYTGSRQGGEKG